MARLFLASAGTSEPRTTSTVYRPVVINDPGGAARAIARALGRQLERSGCVAGCPVATVALEVMPEAGAIRMAADEAFASWEALLVQRLADRGYTPGEASRLATFSMAAIEGALVLSRVRRTIEPLNIVGDYLNEFFARPSAD
jgi:TetR/AcrR family transcriptional repressor of lmrAB and yxaGH operons